MQDNEIDLKRRTGSVSSLCANLAELDEIVLEVTESAQALSVNFMLRRHGVDTADDSGLFLRVGPADIVEETRKVRGLVHCGGSTASCRRRRMGAVSVDRADYPILHLKLGGESIEVCDTSQGGEYLRAVALRVATALSPIYSCILLSDGQCFDCCLRKALNTDERPALVIASIGDALNGL